MEHTILEYLVRFGPPVLFLAQVFGIFGLPIPDEFLMTVAGALIRRGQLGGPATLLAAVAGCTSGITLSYVLGRTVGFEALHRRLRIHQDAFARAQRWFDRWGHWLLTFGYFIPGVRHLTAIAAGSAPIDYGRFARWAYPGAVLWCSVFIGLGYATGDRWREVAAALDSHVRPVLIGAACLVGIVLLIRFVRRDRGAA